MAGGFLRQARRALTPFQDRGNLFRPDAACFDRGRFLARWASIAPYALVVAAWKISWTVPSASISRST